MSEPLTEDPRQSVVPVDDNADEVIVGSPGRDYPPDPPWVGDE